MRVRGGGRGRGRALGRVKRDDASEASSDAEAPKAKSKTPKVKKLSKEARNKLIKSMTSELQALQDRSAKWRDVLPEPSDVDAMLEQYK
jgi:hypothetical protein